MPHKQTLAVAALAAAIGVPVIGLQSAASDQGVSQQQSGTGQQQQTSGGTSQQQSGSGQQQTGGGGASQQQSGTGAVPTAAVRGAFATRTAASRKTSSKHKKVTVKHRKATTKKATARKRASSKAHR